MQLNRHAGFLGEPRDMVLAFASRYVSAAAGGLGLVAIQFGLATAAQPPNQIVADRAANVQPLSTKAPVDVSLVAEFFPPREARALCDRAGELSKRGTTSGDNQALAQAVEAYRHCLTLIPRGAFPLDWAAMQNNLGNALRVLGERESGTQRLEEAVVAFRAALEEYTRERVPLDWAVTQNNLGTALRALGERDAAS